MKKPRIVILGAGYAGLTTTVRLQKSLGVNEAEIILINNNTYHYETTWLHEASAGTLSYDRVRYEISKVIDQNKVQFIKDTVVDIKKDAKRILLLSGEIEYDFLVIALGSVPETFGIKGLKEYAFSISNLNSARKIRNHIEYQFATYGTEEYKQQERITIIVGGAGFTGIEFLGELVNRIPKLSKEHDVDYNKVRIICVEAAPTVLPGFDEELVKYAVAILEKKGVEFRIGTAIKECTADGILVSAANDNVEEIIASTVVWAAGVRGNPLIDKSGIETMRGRVKVNKDLRAPEEESIFVIGDSSLIINEETNRPYPPTAQIAMQQAETCSKNITLLVRNESKLEEFQPDLKGSVCSLGDDDAIGLVFG